MARLHEHQGKTLLASAGAPVPRGLVVRTPAAARAAAEDLGPRVVLKAQAWITGRKAHGAVVFATGADAAEAHAKDLLAMSFGNFPVTEVLVEEYLDIERELFVSIIVDDAAQTPLLLLDAEGGSGIEERAATVRKVPLSPTRPVARAVIEREVAPLGLGARSGDVVDAIMSLEAFARDRETRSLEINPLVITADGRVIVADCRLTVDDYAVFRHPELGIEIARELDHPATDLERLAYKVEDADHRGTFYFAQLPTDHAASSRGLIGFHGAGGGGSMMSMDAVTNEGFVPANFCDTSGNPSVAKVYRAARIILAQPDLVGYFGSGSGVASQEQYHSAYGLAKAFLEYNLPIPAVVRLGGNSEDRAVEILQDACRDLPGVVEGYRKDDTPAFCAQRFKDLVEAAAGSGAPLVRHVPPFVGAKDAGQFPIAAGVVWIDRAHCTPEAAAAIVDLSSGLLRLDEGLPTLAVDVETVASKDSELIACEIESRRAGFPILFVDLTLP